MWCEKARDSKEELKKCEQSSKEGIEKIKKNIQSKELKTINVLLGLLVGMIVIFQKSMKEEKMSEDRKKISKIRTIAIIMIVL